MEHEGIYYHFAHAMGEHTLVLCDDIIASHSVLPGGASIPFYPDRKSTRLNSSHSQISYAVFCLKKKKQHHHQQPKSQQAVDRPEDKHNRRPGEQCETWRARSE